MKNGKVQKIRNESDASSQSVVAFIVDIGAKEMQTSENKSFPIRNPFVQVMLSIL